MFLLNASCPQLSSARATQKCHLVDFYIYYVPFGRGLASLGTKQGHVEFVLPRVGCRTPSALYTTTLRLNGMCSPSNPTCEISRLHISAAYDTLFTRLIAECGRIQLR